jgi:hypothetical protein
MIFLLPIRSSHVLDWSYVCHLRGDDCAWPADASNQARIWRSILRFVYTGDVQGWKVIKSLIQSIPFTFLVLINSSDSGELHNAKEGDSIQFHFPEDISLFDYEFRLYGQLENGLLFPIFTQGVRTFFSFFCRSHS